MDEADVKAGHTSTALDKLMRTRITDARQSPGLPSRRCFSTVLDGMHPAVQQHRRIAHAAFLQG